MRSTYEAVEFEVRMQIVPTRSEARGGAVDYKTNAQAGLHRVFVVVVYRRWHDGSEMFIICFCILG